MQSETKVEALIPRAAAFTLLVVDDEVTTRNLCRDVATDAELQVYVASTTEEALEILEQHPIKAEARKQGGREARKNLAKYTK